MTTTAPPTDERPTRLRRAVTGPLLFLFILGDVLGAGVYALVGELSAESGGMLWLPLLVALLMAMLTAASYAELVTKYPQAGGSAVYAQRAYGRPLLSFLAIRRSAPVQPALNGAGLGLAAGACAWVAVDLWCPVAYVPHLLLGHVLPLFVLAGAGALLGQALLSPR